jgi:CBS domain containing-hemolysin-like protein
MWLELFIWTLFAVLAAAASATQTIAEIVREIQPATKTARANRLDFWGGIVSAVATALDGAMVVATLLPFTVDMGVLALGVAASTIIVLVLSDLARKWARKHLDKFVLPLFGDTVPFLPLVESREDSARAEETRDETVEQMVEASEKVGLIESDEHEMISGILQLDQTLAREIMVPRIDVVALDVESSLRDAIKVVIDGSYSRVPVFEETIDRVVGMLYSKDLLKTIHDSQDDVPIRSLVRPAFFVPESKRLDELLQELQANKVHMAIVIDEYGGTAGIVTIEDILEEIVGEIQDEYDATEEPQMQRVNANEAVFDARVNVDKVNEELGTNLPTDNNTLGGLVYQRLDKMPRAGDQIRVDDATLTVQHVIGRRIKQVRVTKLSNEPTIGAK